MSPLSLVILYALFRMKHFLCDYALQTNWIAQNKGTPGRDGWKALFMHTAGHAFGTILIVMIFAPALWWLGIVDFLIHSGIDLFKTRITRKMGWTPANRPFWIAIGADQEAHNFTHLAYIIVIWMHVTGGF